MSTLKSRMDADRLRDLRADVSLARDEVADLVAEALALNHEDVARLLIEARDVLQMACVLMPKPPAPQPTESEKP